MRDFDELWDYSHPEETEHKFRNVLEKNVSVDNDGYIAELWTQIARTQGLQGEFSEAHETLNQVEKLLAEDLPAPRIRYLLERGRVFNSSSRQAEALPFFHMAWELGIKSGEDDYAVDAAHMLGISEATPEKRMDWNLKALKLAEDSPKANRWLGSLYNNIGWSQVDAGNLVEAYDLFERALEFRMKQGNPRSIFIARWSVAKVLRLMNQVHEALRIQEELRMESEKTPGKDGYVYEEIAECLLLLNRNEEACPYFSHAFDILSLDPWLVQNEPERVSRLKELSEI